MKINSLRIRKGGAKFDWKSARKRLFRVMETPQKRLDVEASTRAQSSSERCTTREKHEQ